MKNTTKDLSHKNNFKAPSYDPIKVTSKDNGYVRKPKQHNVEVESNLFAVKVMIMFALMTVITLSIVNTFTQN